MTESSKKVNINAIDRALDILEYLFAKNQEMPITQISKDLGVYKSTVYRTLVTLQNRGYIKQNAETGKYSLGIKVRALASKMKNDVDDIADIAGPVAEELNDKYGETCNIAVMEIGYNGTYDNIIVYQASSKWTVNANSPLGSLTECYCSGVGKCLLAYCEGLDFGVYEKNPMIKYTNTTITKISKLKDELEQIREQGYAIDNEERERGMYCIAAPILKNGVSIASISLSGPPDRMKDGRWHEMVQDIRKAGQELSKRFSI